MTKISIIGAGKLGCAIADGLLVSGFSPKNLILTRRNTTRLTQYATKGVKTLTNNLEATQQADVVIICVKPQKMEPVLTEINTALHKQILISTITGVTISEIETIINKKLPIYRAMPNTAAAIQQSITCIASFDEKPERKKTVTQIFEQIGKTVYIDESLMASATVLAASGIAFALRYIRASMQGGIEIGFSSELAQKIAAQTIKGAAELILTHNNHPESEIDKVTTPQGITITGLNKMEQVGFSSSVVQGILASKEKIEKL